MKGKAIPIIAAALSLTLLAGTASAAEYTGSESYQSGKYAQALSRVSMTGDPRADLVSIARSQIGYQEGNHADQLSGQVYGNGKFTEYGHWYGLHNDWAAMFVSWCADQAGVSRDVIPSHYDVMEGLDWFAARGLAYTGEQVRVKKYTPRPGDLVYFKNSSSAKTVNHVGIVTGYSNGRIYTVEGDTCYPGSVSNGGMVTAQSYPITNTYIVYICAPNFGTAGTSVLPAGRSFSPWLLVNNDWHRHILPAKYFFIRNGDQYDR